jgi:hypothetical protein
MKMEKIQGSSMTLNNAVWYMHLQVAYDHPIVFNGSAKIPTTPKGQRCLLL